MKKTIIVLLVLTMAFTLFSCGSKNPDRTENLGDVDSEINDQENVQSDSNEYLSFYTKKFEESFTSIYDDPDGKISFKYPGEMTQTDSSLTCMDPFLTISVDHGVKDYGNGLEDASAFLESICERVESVTIGGKDAVKGIYNGEQSAGGEYVVFVGGETHKFLTISFVVMPGYQEEYSKVVDKMLAELKFLP